MAFILIRKTNLNEVKTFETKAFESDSIDTCPELSLGGKKFKTGKKSHIAASSGVDSSCETMEQSSEQRTGRGLASSTVTHSRERSSTDAMSVLSSQKPINIANELKQLP